MQAIKADTLKETYSDRAWAPLMSAVIIQAIVDLRNKDYRIALDALLFLTGKEFSIWSEACGMEEKEFSLDIVPAAWKKIYPRYGATQKKE